MIQTHHRSNGFSVPMLIVGIILIVAIMLFVVPSIQNASEAGRLKAEIDRVSSKSGVIPSSISCSNVEGANICYADYAISQTAATSMLVGSGYSMAKTTDKTISGADSSTSIRVDSESGATSTSVTLKFKDINVTL